MHECRCLDEGKCTVATGLQLTISIVRSSCDTPAFLGPPALPRPAALCAIWGANARSRVLRLDELRAPAI